MSKIRSLKKKLNQKTLMIALMTSLVISSFIVINKYDLISRAIGYFEAISNGYTKEIKSIELKTTGYDTGTEGALKITKSAEWTNLNEATIKIKVESNPIDDQKDKDIIFLLDISSSFGEGDVLAKFQKNIVEAYKEIIDASPNNRVAFFTFSTNAEIKFDFTRDKTKLENSLAGLKFGGSTNFYNALKLIEQYLTTYTFSSNKELHLVFISDGFANEGRGSDEKEYEVLKQKYPNIIIDGVREGGGEGGYDDIKRISDRQYYGVNANGNRDYSITLKDIILDATLSNSYYSSINIFDYINPTYFKYNSSSSYYGTSSVTTENGVEKVVWDLNDGRFKSGYSAELTIKLDLKDIYHGVEAYFPTNNSLSILATDINISDISANTTDTPVLQSWFNVTYDSNTPSGCTSTYNKTERHFPFTNVTIKNQQLLCEGWEFKGWELDETNVEKINSETFVMPKKNIKIGGEWRQLSINKSMDGTINERSTLYEIISDQAVMDNVKSDYVSSSVNIYNISSDTNGKGIYIRSTTKDNEYPIKYFRGDIDNNNVIFGGMCWKIVRTTDTGGIKIIYNGTPTDGKCNSTGVDTTIGQTKIIQPTQTSLASSMSYTYGREWPTFAKPLGANAWTNIVDKIPYVMAWYDSSYKFGTDVTWDGTKYNLVNPVSYDSSTPDSTLEGKYMCYVGGGQATSCVIAHYMIITNYGLRIVQLNNGETGPEVFNKAKNTTWYYSHDVDYSNGTYTLINPIAVKPYSYGDYIETLSQGYHYTCMTDNATNCTKVKYAYFDAESYLQQSYIELEGGVKIETALDEMLINPSNEKSSLLKEVTDEWYAANLTSYTNMLEDTVWCNDKVVTTEGNYGGWKIGGNSRSSLITSAFISIADINEESTCRKVDAYTVNETTKGNGYLTYPVGHLTKSELIYAGSSTVSHGTANTQFYLFNNTNYWTMTPAYHNNMIGQYASLYQDGKFVIDPAGQSFYVRPVVSLKSGVYASTGNGTPTNPYVIEME